MFRKMLLMHVRHVPVQFLLWFFWQRSFLVHSQLYPQPFSTYPTKIFFGNKRTIKLFLGRFGFDALPCILKHSPLLTVIVAVSSRPIKQQTL